jgi:hypothetical protein
MEPKGSLRRTMQENTKDSELNNTMHYPNSLSSNFLLNQIWFVTVVPKYLNCATFSKEM